MIPAGVSNALSAYATPLPVAKAGAVEAPKVERVRPVEPKREAAEQRAESDREQDEERVEAERERAEGGVGRRVDLSI